MSTRRALLLTFVLLVGCHRSPAPPVEGRPDPGTGPAPAAEVDPIATLGDLAGAARDDDGARLDALIHPEHGLWLWIQPGAMVAPTQLLFTGDARPPTRRLDPEAFNDYWQETFWNLVAGGVDHALAHLDRDPPDRGDPKYGDCADDDGAGAGSYRAWLSSPEPLSEFTVEMAHDGGIELAPGQVKDLIHLHAWGLDVYLARDQGRLWVVHLMVWTPCDA